jgi:hypothetical protein
LGPSNELGFSHLHTFFDAFYPAKNEFSLKKVISRSIYNNAKLNQAKIFPVKQSIDPQQDPIIPQFLLSK